MAQAQARYACQQCGAVDAEMGRPVRGLRRLEQHGRGAAARRAAEGPRPAPAAGAALGFVGLRGDGDRAAAPAHRDRRTRPGVRRRARAGLGDPGRRRSRHRQVDPAAAGRRRARRRAAPTPPISPARRRSTRCGCAPSGSASPTRPVRLAAATSVRDILAALDDGRTRPISWSSIRSRRCISTRSTARRARSARCAARPRS